MAGQSEDRGTHGVLGTEAQSQDASYPEGFDASCGLSARAMRTANGLMASVVGKRELDVPMVAATLESFARAHGVIASDGSRRE